MVALHFIYELRRPMKVPADPYPLALVMAAGINDYIWTSEDIAALLD